MAANDWLAEKFEENRGHLRAVAYRILGSLSEADDAVQEAWLRLSRSDANAIENLGGWLTTVVSRVCLDILRSRTSRREEALESQVERPAGNGREPRNPEEEALMADSIGAALLIVLDRLDPAERLAFVLHDMFAVSFDEIASILGRSPEAARQLASRARRRVQGVQEVPKATLLEHRRIVDAFVDALRRGDFERLIAVLDSELVVKIDRAAARPGAPVEIRGARNWAKGAIAFSQQVGGAVQPALVDGEIGLVWTAGGGVFRVLRFTFADGRIASVDIIADPARLGELDVAVLKE